MIWIKLYCDLLDDFEFSRLSDVARFQLVALMLLAARLNNELPDDETWLRRKISSENPIDIEELRVRGFLVRVESDNGKTSAINDAINYDSITRAEQEQSKAEKSTATAEQTKSIFSLEQCEEYAMFLKRNGEPIKSTTAFARWLHESADQDVKMQSYFHPQSYEQELQNICAVCVGTGFFYSNNQRFPCNCNDSAQLNLMENGKWQ